MSLIPAADKRYCFLSGSSPCFLSALLTLAKKGRQCLLGIFSPFKKLVRSSCLMPIQEREWVRVASAHFFTAHNKAG